VPGLLSAQAVLALAELVAGPDQAPSLAPPVVDLAAAVSALVLAAVLFGRLRDGVLFTGYLLLEAFRRASLGVLNPERADALASIAWGCIAVAAALLLVYHGKRRAIGARASAPAEPPPDATV
jgi:hypothetical protein